jgi:hypothetical protein
MSDWLHSLPVLWMAILVFGFTYLITAGIYAVITVLAVGERARSFKVVSPGLLPPLGIIFGLFVVFAVRTALRPIRYRLWRVAENFRPAHRARFALAERLCRKIDRINPARVRGPYRGTGRDALAPEAKQLAGLPSAARGRLVFATP